MPLAAVLNPFDAHGNLPYTGITMKTPPSVARLEARLPSGVHALLKRAAAVQGRTLTDFVVTAAREAACKIIEEDQIIRLSINDQRRIARAILSPPAPARALTKAFQRHRDLFGPQ